MFLRVPKEFINYSLEFSIVLKVFIRLSKVFLKSSHFPLGIQIVVNGESTNLLIISFKITPFGEFYSGV